MNAYLYLMSCYFSVIGADFEPDKFIARTKLDYAQISYTGTPRFNSKPEKGKRNYSILSTKVSHAGFDDFNQQVKDAIEYLRVNYDKLKMIADTPGVDYANLDFGVDYKYNFVQSHYFPPELVKLAGELGISFEISLYTAGDDEEEELA